jgi:hypothetical protein
VKFPETPFSGNYDAKVESAVGSIVSELPINRSERPISAAFAVDQRLFSPHSSFNASPEGKRTNPSTL